MNDLRTVVGSLREPHNRSNGFPGLVPQLSVFVNGNERFVAAATTIREGGVIGDKIPMTVSEEQSTSPTERLVALFEADEEAQDAPRFVTAALGLVAAVLVAASTFSAIETGYVAIGMSVLAAVALFLGTIFVFEAGRRLGADD